ncbi:right-handed parallel beta-helix repeat-containing protein [Actinospica robiniae]|uniref:right-handed parallel beta-helix repeat-containing protein n=1 Tax=Actinospica robiniae TaxID=304901 RepID=UPI0004112889|nr:right-handed parallel beta-helix repeat-containing protein [Actinospica robiniae]
MRPPLSRPATAAAAALAAIVAASPAAYASAPEAKTLYVATNGHDADNACTARAHPCRHLYYAIHNAATYTGDAVTVVVAAGTYTENDEIDAPALASLTVEAVPGTVTVEGRRRTHASVFTIDSSTSTLQGLTITGGDADRGGGINSYSGTVTLNTSTVTGNTSPRGGGIFNDGGTLTLQASTVSHNTAEYEIGEGGGIYNFGGTVTLTHSYVTDNTARYTGGGIYNGAGTMTATDSTITRNTAAPTPGSGGGIYQAASATSTLTRTLVASNNPDNCVPADLCP